MASIHDDDPLERWRHAWRLDPELLRRFRVAFVKKFRGFEVAASKLPKPARAALKDQFEVHPLELAARHDSAVDGATKLVYRTRAGLLLETVILRVASGRTSLCVSTQVGCAARCDFCATGRMGIARNLSSSEILDQVVQAGQLAAAEDRRLRNLVFMGMGEPLHNETHLHAALAVLTDPQAFHIHPGRILVSTVGVPNAMLRLADRFPEVRIALSLHSVRPEVRQRLIPISERHGLAPIRAALKTITASTGRDIMIEYLMLADVNDTDDDQLRLVEYLRDIPAHINLIPYNAIDDAPHLKGSSPARQAEFAAGLRAAGFRVTRRYSLGADIAAACGQLVRSEHRRREYV